ncbi:MAG: hypothetical protein U5L11_13930 [Arhodomonas sp.]|nr:hypothetical protein [Arhodomonas sp.]
MHAEDGPKSLFTETIHRHESLGLIENVQLYVNDEVTGNSRTNAAAVKQKRLTLEQSGIRVYEEPLVMIAPFTTRMILSGLGMRTNEGFCIGTFGVQVQRRMRMEYEGAKEPVAIVGMATLYERRMIAVSGDSLNGQFASHGDEAVTELAADILSSRRVDSVKRFREEHAVSIEEEPLRAGLSTLSSTRRKI